MLIIIKFVLKVPSIEVFFFAMSLNVSIFAVSEGRKTDYFTKWPTIMGDLTERDDIRLLSRFFLLTRKKK